MSTESIIDNDTGLEIPQAAKDSIAKLNTVEAGVAAMLKKYAAAPDASTPEGYELAKAEAKEIAAVRISTDKAHKIAKAPYWDGGKRIDAMKKSIVDRISPLEEARKAAVKAVDDEQERIEREAAEKEQVRIEFIETRVKHISEHAQFVTLEQVNGALTSLGDIDFSEYDEFADIAREKASEATAALTERRDALKAQAEEAARLEAQRKEQEKRQIDMDHQEANLINAEIDAAAKRAAEKRLADDANANRVAKIKGWIQRISEIPESVRTLDDVAPTEIALDNYVLDMFEEFSGEAADAIERALSDVYARANELRKQKLIETEAEAWAENERRDKAAADIEAAKQQAIADEQARVKKEQAAEARRKAKAEKLARLEPDQEQLRAWLGSLPEMPAMKTREGERAANSLTMLLNDMSYAIEGMTADESQAA